VMVSMARVLKRLLTRSMAKRKPVKPKKRRKATPRSMPADTATPQPSADAEELQLPDDINVAHEMIRELLEQLNDSRRNQEQLRNRIEQLIRQFYGSKAEKVDPNQMKLFGAEELERFEPSMPELPQEPPDDNEPRKRRKRGGRRELPKDLPRRRVEHEVPAAERMCPCCKEEMTAFREDITEQLDYVPASLVVVEHVRKLYSCRKGCDEAVVQAPKPHQPIEKGLPGPGLLAYIIGSKFSEHLPLYRQEGILERNGFRVGRSTMCYWIAAIAEMIEPLLVHMKGSVLTSFCVATDETGLLVLDRANKRTYKGRIWVFCGDVDHPWLIYDFTDTRERDGPEAFLGDYEGYLQADAYSGYDGIYRRGKIVEVACWMHARRYWFNASKVEPTIPMPALAMIRLLYRYERDAKSLSAEDRYAYRQEYAIPVLDRMEEWLEDVGPRILPKSPAGDAIRYTRNQWQALRRYTEDGRLEIDNGRSERGLRLIALGRRNWLFAGSPEGGRRAASLYTLTGTCMLHGIDPETYLRDLFRELPAHPVSRIHEWTPLAWAARQPQAQA